MMGTERFPETLCLLSELTRLTAREDFVGEDQLDRSCEK
jgi:hypothetical protein